MKTLIDPTPFLNDSISACPNFNAENQTCLDTFYAESDKAYAKCLVALDKSKNDYVECTCKMLIAMKPQFIDCGLQICPESSPEELGKEYPLSVYLEDKYYDCLALGFL